MEFKHIGEYPEDLKELNCYGGTTHEPGGVVDIPEAFVEKARNNPDYEEVVEAPKKRGRPKKTED